MPDRDPIAALVDAGMERTTIFEDYTPPENWNTSYRRHKRYTAVVRKTLDGKWHGYILDLIRQNADGPRVHGDSHNEVVAKTIDAGCAWCRDILKARGSVPPAVDTELIQKVARRLREDVDTEEFGFVKFYVDSAI